MTQPRRLMILRPGEARCGGQAVRPTRTDRPLPIELNALPQNGATVAPAYRLTFRIDSSGRPLSINDPLSAQPDVYIPANTRDLVPAFSAWRFEPGQPRRDCELMFNREILAVDAAPVAELHRLFILGQPSVAFRSQARSRVVPAGSTCFDPSPGVRRRVYPAFDEIPQAPGTAAYSVIAYDIDADGTPINVRLQESGGNAELDRQGVDAIRRSRFAPGARQGCNHPFWVRSDEPLAAPAPPDLARYRSAAATCPAEGAQWAQAPRLEFPPEFERRGVEGWAMVRFDVAPWGQTGNVEVLAAEPAARFGTQALAIAQTARAVPSTAGLTGCVHRITFRVAGEGDRQGGTAD